MAPPVVPAGTLRDREQPRLQAGELTLRPWEQSDAPALAEAYADPEIRRWHVRTMDEEESREWVAERARRWADEIGVDWAIEEGGRVVGRIGFRELNLFEGYAEAAYWVMPFARGRGIAERALRAASDWMLDEVGFHRLALMHSPANEASCRVAERAAYRAEGTQRQAVLHEDGWHDSHVHARIGEEPRD